MKSTFKIAFYLKRKVKKRDGTTPIVARITINGQISQFNTKLYVKPSLWSVKLGIHFLLQKIFRYLYCV